MFQFCGDLLRGRFSLAALLIGVTVSAVGLGVGRAVLVASHERGEAIAELSESRFSIQFHERFGGCLVASEEPSWWVSLVGDDFLNRPIMLWDQGDWELDPELAKPNRLSTSESIAAINRLWSLEKVSISRKSLAPRLRELDLPRVRELFVQSVGDVDLVDLQGLPALDYLRVDSGSVTGACLPTLLARHRLKTLNLLRCPLEETHLESLLACETLEEVGLASDLLTDRAAEILGRHSRLAKIYLEGPITDASCRHLARCRTLTSIYLNKTKITAEGLEALRILPALSVLQLTECDIGDEVVPVLLKYPALRLIYASGTRFTSTGCQKLKERGILVMLGVI